MSRIPVWEPDDEEHPRNATAIRTAILMGAEFTENERGQWEVKGLSTGPRSNKTMLAWLYLVYHGICVDANAKPILCGEMKPENSRYDTYRKTALIMARRNNANDEEGLHSDREGTQGSNGEPGDHNP